MSEVLAGALSQPTLGPDLDQELETEKLSKVLRDRTWGSHERAEFGDFEQALVKGVMRKEVYAFLLSQVYYVYKALEDEAERLTDDEVASRVIFPEVHRVEKVERDLAFYYGPDWREQITPLEITQEYVDRIHAAAADSPARYVAHNYNRYLADLSGGFVIDRAIQRAYDLELDGRHLYQFDEIENAKAFKNMYRGILDELPLDADGKRALIEEALIAYEFNIVLNETIADLHDPIIMDGVDPDTIDLTHPH